MPCDHRIVLFRRDESPERSTCEAIRRESPLHSAATRPPAKERSASGASDFGNPYHPWPFVLGTIELVDPLHPLGQPGRIAVADGNPKPRVGHRGIPILTRACGHSFQGFRHTHEAPVACPPIYGIRNRTMFSLWLYSGPRNLLPWARPRVLPPVAVPRPGLMRSSSPPSPVPDLLLPWPSHPTWPHTPPEEGRPVSMVEEWRAGRAPPPGPAERACHKLCRSR